MEHLVQVIVPLRGNDGELVPHTAFNDMYRDLTERFGSVGAHMHTPAEGEWRPEGHDGAVMYEVLCERLDRCWWHDYRRHLEARFGQQGVYVRALAAEKL